MHWIIIKSDGKVNGKDFYSFKGPENALWFSQKY